MQVEEKCRCVYPDKCACPSEAKETKLLVVTTVVRVPIDFSPHFDVRAIETKYDYLTDIEAYKVVASIDGDTAVEWLF